MSKMEVLQDVLKEKYQIQESLSSNTNLVNEFGFESISLVELCTELCKKFNVRICSSDAIKWTTVQSILETLDQEKVS